jgi:hypothetical protein
MISYDLRKKRDYEKLYEAIKSYGTWAHILESSWAIVTDQSASSVRDRLIKFIDNDDGLFVLKSGVEGAWRSVLCIDDWLKDHL